MSQPDWKLCIICQEHSNEPLQCPAKSKRIDVGARYTSLANNIRLFQEIKATTSFFNPKNVDDGSGIESTLRKNDTVWHKSCRNKFNNTELKRAQKRKTEEDDDTHPYSPVKSRRSSTSINKGTGVNEEICFFCEKDAGSEGLRVASTSKIDTRVKQCALELQDGKLLAKLSTGDMVALNAKYHINCLAALYNRRRSCSS